MSVFAHPDRFLNRHIGPRQAELSAMLAACGVNSLDELLDQAVPASIRSTIPSGILPQPRSEAEVLEALRDYADRNESWRSYLGLGYHDCHTPPVIQRCILENPGWYTQYTPYQAEISQGRLECLATFQTLIADLCALPIANASLLDEATAVAESVHLAHAHHRGKRCAIQIDADCHPQVIAVVQTRCQPLGITVEVVAAEQLAPGPEHACVILAYPGSSGRVLRPKGLAEAAAASGALMVAVSDPMALCLLPPPGEWGADVVCGSAQRLGVPLGGGGPHAGFFAVKEDYKRLLPGRLVGLSRDRAGRPAYRLALQTREQHIRRDKATSNICTAQALLANIAAAYAVYHGPEGLRAIAAHIHACACAIAAAARQLGLGLRHEHFFDTLVIEFDSAPAADAAISRASERRINLRRSGEAGVLIAANECMGDHDLLDLIHVLAGHEDHGLHLEELARAASPIRGSLARQSPFCQHPVFHAHRSEHGLLRWLKQLERQDLSLCHSMIPLGSCTMKLNAAAEMLSLTLPGFARIHPFAPSQQLAGYAALAADLERWLSAITGLNATSLQPNSGAQGEYAGLLAIAAWHRSRGDEHRRICLIPSSAHGTNPASAVMAGMQVVPVACDDGGNIDVEDLSAKAAAHADKLSCLMITYPSTHGVFEESIRSICDIIHRHGGQVYMDGANMNAQVGWTSPGFIGADVCHLNLHKTFCIPHGGGGPGVGPICVAEHLAPFLPSHQPQPGGVGPVAAAPYGSASILTISWAYIALMGESGLSTATAMAILNANYLAAGLRAHFPILYTGALGLVAHECILDCRPFKKLAGVEVEDIAKRLMDFGFHAPTVSWPVAGTLMVEPTESEPKEELDRFIAAMRAIRAEIGAIAGGDHPVDASPLRLAPHTAEDLASADWQRPYSREQAAFPLPWVASRKYWPPVGRIDAAYGDRNLFCACAPVAEMTEHQVPKDTTLEPA
ncbi:MAG: glycine dehydrogenase (aminomethyl-transferring) [Planctomycetota bacterium]|nr:MAG: glycine dehydrogenase (aminomethyl-transferring) [Planctomycetota bacterium]